MRKNISPATRALKKYEETRQTPKPRRFKGLFQRLRATGGMNANIRRQATEDVNEKEKVHRTGTVSHVCSSCKRTQNKLRNSVRVISFSKCIGGDGNHTEPFVYLFRWKNDRLHFMMMENFSSESGIHFI